MISEQDPPAVAQPTLPPPPVAPAGGLPAQKRPRGLVTGSIAAACAVAVGLYAAFGTHAVDPEAAAQAAPQRPHDLVSRIERALQALPAQAGHRPCTGESTRVPVVLYSENTAPEEELTAGASSLFKPALPLHAIGELPEARRVAVVRTLEITEPRASVGAPSPGRYEAQLAIVDTSTGAALCHTRVVAWSSSLAEQPGLAERTVQVDFADRVRSAVAEAGARLHVELAF